MNTSQMMYDMFTQSGRNKSTPMASSPLGFDLMDSLRSITKPKNQLSMQGIYDRLSDNMAKSQVPSNYWTQGYKNPETRQIEADNTLNKSSIPVERQDLAKEQMANAFSTLLTFAGGGELATGIAPMMKAGSKLATTGLPAYMENIFGKTPEAKRRLLQFIDGLATRQAGGGLGKRIVGNNIPDMVKAVEATSKIPVSKDYITKEVQDIISLNKNLGLWPNKFEFM